VVVRQYCDVVNENLGDCVQHGGSRGGETGAPCEEMLCSLIACVTGAHGGGTVNKTMIMSVISKVTAVNSNFCKGSNAIFVQNAKIAAFWGNEFFFIYVLEGRWAGCVFQGVRGGRPFCRTVREKNLRSVWSGGQKRQYDFLGNQGLV